MFALLLCVVWGGVWSESTGGSWKLSWPQSSVVWSIKNDRDKVEIQIQIQIQTLNLTLTSPP